MNFVLLPKVIHDCTYDLDGTLWCGCPCLLSTNAADLERMGKNPHCTAAQEGGSFLFSMRVNLFGLNFDAQLHKVDTRDPR